VKNLEIRKFGLKKIINGHLNIRLIMKNKLLNKSQKPKCTCFKKYKFTKRFYTYKKPPPNEPNYLIKNYFRVINKCKVCGHFWASHKINVEEFYKKNYSLISHGNNIKKKFEKIVKLGNKSDNFFRVKRVLNYFKNLNSSKINLLDVGSGLSIFIYQLKKKVKWNIYGVEPDINFVNFSKNLKLNVTHSNLKSKIFNKKKFNIITLNKVIEHVKNPVKFLEIVNKLLKNDGYIYVEVPDGTAASKQANGQNREEFFVDHLHIFSVRSLTKCLKLANFKILKIKKIREKSDKLTIYLFAKKII